MDFDCVKYYNVLWIGLIVFGWLEFWFIESVFWNLLLSYYLGFLRRIGEMVIIGKICSVKECC